MQGETVGQYELVQELGSGSFGTVWKAKHRAADSWRAVKIAKDPALVEQFRREFEVLDRLDHQHIVRVYDLVTTGDTPAIIFEYVDGTDLEKLLKAQGRLPWPEAVRIALEMLEGLAVAHAAGLLHRDIKPSNILLTATGQVKIADFGLVAAAERSGSVLFSQQEGSSHVAGTHHYMAPEVEERGEALPQSDLYSLGVVLYRCLTGRVPRGMASPVSAYGCPDSLDRLLAALLAYDTADRPASPVAAMGLLETAVARLPEPASGPRSRPTPEAPSPAGLVTDGASAADTQSALEPLRGQTPQQAGDLFYCPQCGGRASWGHEFCANCGCSLSAAKDALQI